MQESLPLRAHMALCLLGFRGSGYSPAFVAAMAAVQADLRADPSRIVRLLDRPDRICEACPNLANGGCTLGGPGHESHMRSQDRAVLARLDLTPDSEIPWSQILARMAERVRAADLPEICTTCPWLPLGVCRESVDALGPGADGAAGPGAAGPP